MSADVLDKSAVQSSRSCDCRALRFESDLLELSAVSNELLDAARLHDLLARMNGQ